MPMDAGVSISESGCRSLYIRQQMQECLYQTAGAIDSISDSGCRRLYIRQRMQESLYQTANARDIIRQDARYHIRQDAGVSISDSGCKKLYQTADASDSL